MWRILVTTDINDGISENDIDFIQSKESKDWFSSLISYNTVIMDKFLWERINTSLPKCASMVLSKEDIPLSKGMHNFSSFEDIYSFIDSQFPQTSSYVLGLNIFKEALPYSNIIFKTEVNASIMTSKYFPKLDSAWILLASSNIKYNGLVSYTHKIFVRDSISQDELNSLLLTLKNFDINLWSVVGSIPNRDFDLQ